MSVSCSPVVTSSEVADLLAHFYVMLSVFVTFQYSVLGRMWYLIASIPDLSLTYLLA